MSSYNTSGAPAKKRSPIVWIILGVILVVVVPTVVCVGCCGGLGMWGMNMILSSPPYVNALERVKGNHEVVAKLGEPIETDGMPTLMNFNDAGGTADFNFKVKGPKGNATVSFNAVKENGAWRYTTFNVTFSDGSSISLADDANSEESADPAETAETIDVEDDSAGTLDGADADGSDESGVSDELDAE
jgi:hypothetical protein